MLDSDRVTLEKLLTRNPQLATRNRFLQVRQPLMILRVHAPGRLKKLLLDL
jgi:hypothetical protein